MREVAVLELYVFQGGTFEEPLTFFFNDSGQ